MERISFAVRPERYRHWKLELEGPVAWLLLDVSESEGLRPGYSLKLNSYDLSVDIELADALMRLRFEHPEVKALVMSSRRERIFCAGANIYMLGSSTHAFKVNFCKFTNETRLYLEEMAEETGVRTICAINGTCAGGGYELAMAAEHLLLQDDGNSAVALPEVPLLAVLPGTGGLTRLVDKRKVRRDLADVFSTLAEGVRGQRAVDWGLVDAIAPRSKFEEALKQTVAERVAQGSERPGPGVELPALEPERESANGHELSRYRYVSLDVDAEKRVARLELRAPAQAPPADAAALREAGAELWSLRAFRELDAALLDLRFNHLEVGVLVLTTRGDAARVLEHDQALEAAERGGDWFAKEVRLHIKRVLKRLDLTARSLIALIEPGSCFAGCLAELALAADRSYMLDADEGASIQFGPLNFGRLPMSNGLSRLHSRFLGRPERVAELSDNRGPFSTQESMEWGLVTFTPDDIDWDDEVRIAIEERASFSPDALTGMEASLRFGGPETLETKIFGRLSAWQNWIFQRPNAVGEHGALTRYGTPERPHYDFTRT